MLAILLNLTYTNDIYMRTKKSLGSALRGFCMLSKGYDRSFIDNDKHKTVSFMPRVDDIFRRGNSYLNLLSLVESRVGY